MLGREERRSYSATRPFWGADRALQAAVAEAQRRQPLPSLQADHASTLYTGAPAKQAVPQDGAQCKASTLRAWLWLTSLL